MTISHACAEGNGDARGKASQHSKAGKGRGGSRAGKQGAHAKALGANVAPSKSTGRTTTRKLVSHVSHLPFMHDIHDVQSLKFVQ